MWRYTHINRLTITSMWRSSNNCLNSARPRERLLVPARIGPKSVPKVLHTQASVVTALAPWLYRNTPLKQTSFVGGKKPVDVNRKKPKENTGDVYSLFGSLQYPAWKVYSHVGSLPYFLHELMLTYLRINIRMNLIIDMLHTQLDRSLHQLYKKFRTQVY
jgi:hypothetical protein